MMVVSTAATIAALKSVGSVVAKIPEAAKNYADLYERVMELIDANLTLKDENSRLKEELAEERRKAALVDEMEYRDKAYYRRRPIEGKPNGPFCPACFETKRQAITLMNAPHDFVIGGIAKYDCPACKTPIL